MPNILPSRPACAEDLVSPLRPEPTTGDPELATTDRCPLRSRGRSGHHRPADLAPTVRPGAPWAQEYDSSPIGRAWFRTVFIVLRSVSGRLLP
ncbi:hypothetical protein [Streptomyces sp. SP18BB07]|uniref:hypothetical protein n=1 Tax=Streptomyces sp. SP18BB07 TaxID=3002522 RepID=UPI002E777832|nr:hypothetical protein [Streptomyces sp. SP18BB07]MEE1759743.1 hypothetical protein [Streptomyces sp. SP18BB07]